MTTIQGVVYIKEIPRVEKLDITAPVKVRKLAL